MTIRQGPRRRKKKRVVAVAVMLALLVAGAFGLFFPQVSPGRGGEEGGKVEVCPPRGIIVDRNSRVLAETRPVYSLYARPVKLEEPEKTAYILAKLLPQTPEELLVRFRTEKSLIWLAQDLDPAKVAQIRALSLEGLTLCESFQRLYPLDSLGAHILGFVDERGQGLLGVEGFYNDYLLLAEGNPGRRRLVLNVETYLQYRLEKELAYLKKKTGALQAAGVILEAGTGAIVAMASLPAFDPNRFWQAQEGELRNLVIAGNFPLRPVMAPFFKAFLVSGAKDPLGFAWRLGFGKETGVDLVGESPGGLPPSLPGADYLAEIRTTPLQLARAYAALVNGGLLCRPYVAKEILDGNQTLMENSPQCRQVLSGESLLEIEPQPVASGYSFGPRQHIYVAASAFPVGKPRLVEVLFFSEIKKEREPFLTRALPRAMKALYAAYLKPPKAFGLVQKTKKRPSRAESLAQKPGSPRLPNLVGLTLREAVERLQPLGIPYRLRGTGVVVGQKPKPGTKIEKIKECEIILGQQG
ncbi:penicillin-binding transpeptidase domain-containing protein [Thermosulfuriphilus sp.]